MEKEPAFRLHLFIALGLDKGMYFERDTDLQSAHPNYVVYKLFRIKRKKRGGFTYFFVPEKFTFILTESKKHSGLMVLRRRNIISLRKNNPIKSMYRKLRAANYLQP